MKFSPLLPVTLLICLCIPPAYAEDAEQEVTGEIDSEPADTAAGAIIIEGDELQMQMGRRMKSIGNAKLHKGNRDIYGDRIEYDVQNEELQVIGNARIESSDGSIWGPNLKMKMGESTGGMESPSFLFKNQIKPQKKPGAQSSTFANVYEDSNNLRSQNIEEGRASDGRLKRPQTQSRGDAAEVFFEGEDKKRLKDARYTTCEAGNDDWYIKAGELELDDYTKTGTATNARVEFKGVPILYTPWISFSFLNERQSGFLSPTFGTTTRSGAELLTPFYWNISPDMDATLGLRYLSKRGLQYQGEFRYLGERYSGTDNIEYLANDSTSGGSRFYGRFLHNQSFANGFWYNYQVERVSDNQYFADMSTRIIVTSRVNLPQQFSAGYSFGSWGISGLVQKFQTLDGISFPYERLPQLTLTNNKDWGLAETNLTSQWVKFDRNTSSLPAISTTPGSGLITSVTGDRFSAYPSVTIPIERPFGYIKPKFGVNYTKYNLTNPEFSLNGIVDKYQSDSRTLPIFSLDSGLFFDRNMRVVKNYYTQTLEPRLYYLYIPNKDQSLLPVFDSGNSDLNLGTLFQENQYTGNDRINNANQLSLAVTSRMIDARTGEQRLAATIGQRFYFTSQRVGLPGEVLRTSNTSDIVAAVTARLLNKWNLDAAWQYNTDSSRTIKGNIGTRYNPEPGKVLNMSYRFTKNSLEQINVSGQWPLGNNWYGLGRWNYSLRENQPIEGLLGFEYDAGCWQARTVLQRVSTATANANYAIFFQLELGGLTSIGSNPLTLLQRSIPGYTSTGLIPDSYQQPYNE